MISQQSEDRLRGQDAPLLDWESYQSAVAHLPAGQSLKINQTAPDYSENKSDRAQPLDGFKQSRSLTVQFTGSAPTECKLYLGLSASSGCNVQDYGIKSIKTDCSLIKDHQLQISVVSSLSDGSWDLLSACLESVTVYMGGNLQLNAVNASSIAAPAETDASAIDGTGTR